MKSIKISDGVKKMLKVIIIHRSDTKTYDQAIRFLLKESGLDPDFKVLFEGDDLHV